MRKRILIAAAALLLAMPVALVGVLLHTQAGLNLVAGQLDKLQRLGVKIEGLSGTLAGPLYVARFELDHPRVHIVSHDIVVYPQIRGLFVQTLRVSSLTAKDTLIELREAQLPPSTRPPRFLPDFLRIDARGVDFAGIRYVHLNGTAVDVQRAQGRARITSHELRISDFQIDSQQFNTGGDLQLYAQEPMGIELAANGRLRTTAGQELALSASLAGDIDRLSIKTELQQPSRVEVDALFTRPDESWKLTGRVTSPALDLKPWMRKPPFSLRQIALDIEASAAQIQVRGKAGIPEFLDGLLAIDARGRFADRVLHLSSSEIAVDGTPTRLRASGTVAFDGEDPTLDLAAQWNDLQWPISGRSIVHSARGSGKFRGPMPYEFAVDATVDGPQLPPVSGSASGVLSKEQLSITAYSIQALKGSLSGAASLQLAQPRAWSVTANGSNIDPVELHPQFAGRVSFSAKGRGEGLDKKASFALRVETLDGTLRKQTVRGSGTVERDRKGWRVQGAQLSMGDAKLAFDGSWRETITARWSLTAPSLQQLLPEAEGSVQFAGTASGALESLHVSGQLHAENLRYQRWVARQLTADGDIDASGANPSRLSVVAQQIGHGEPLLDMLRMSGAGVAQQHRIGIEVTGLPASRGATPPRARMEVAGQYDEETWNATVTTTQLSRGAGEPEIKIDEPARIQASRSRVSLENLCLIMGAGRLCAQGKWQRAGPWEGTLSGYAIPLASVLPPSGQEAEYAGRIEGRVHAHGAPGQLWQGEAGLHIIDAAIIYRPPGATPETLNLGSGGVAATATPERIDFTFGLQAFTDTFLYANAKLVRNGGNDILRMPLTGDVRARASDANVLPLVFPEIDHAAGVLSANANVTGTLALPEIAGRIELANGELDSYRVNLALRELSLIADLASNGLDFRGTGRAGDGRLEVGGRFTWSGGESRGALQLRGQNLLVADLPEYRVVASPDLRFDIEGERMNVAGEVLIPSARVQPAQLSGAVRPSEDARYIGEHPAEQAGRFVVHSEIRIIMGEDVRIDTFGLQGRITGAVGITMHTSEPPIGRGELAVTEGRYEAYGQELEINRGRLLFESSPLDDPGLDIEARRKIETITVGMNVRGTLQEPRITFFSDPSMPQTQILAYLLTGKRLDEVQGGDRSMISSARDALAMQGGGLLASRLGRRLGLEEVGVESSVDSAGQTNTALVLGKFLSPRLFISYGISLTESINTLKLRYTLSDRWIFKTEAGENQSADVEFTVER